MSKFTLIIFLFLLVVFFIICGVFITKCATHIKSIPNYQNDPDLVSAHDWAVRGSLAVWVTLGVTVLLFILGLFIGVTETLFLAASFILYFFLFLIGGLIIFISICSIIAAKRIGDSQNYSKENSAYTTPKKYATISASIGLVLMGLIFITFIIVLVERSKQKKEKEKEEKEIEEEKAQEVANIIKTKNSRTTV